MTRAIKTACTANLLVSIAVFAAYIVFALLAQLPINENFCGMGPTHLGRAVGPIVPSWTVFAFLEGMILVLFLRNRHFDSRPQDRIACLIFVFTFLYIILLQHLPHRVIFPEDEKNIVVARRDQVLMWYVCCSNAFYAVFGPNAD